MTPTIGKQILIQIDGWEHGLPFIAAIAGLTFGLGFLAGAAVICHLWGETFFR